MGSTGEPERKRRHFSSISPTSAGATTKKQPLAPCSEDKKLDFAVLRYKNQKLSEQLEVQKFEFLALDNKFHQLKEKQKTHDDTLLLVNNHWEWLLNDLESLSASASGSTSSGHHLKHSHVLEDGPSCPTEDDFLRRLMEAGATESSHYVSPTLDRDNMRGAELMTKHILQNVICSLNDMWHVNEVFVAAADQVAEAEDESSRQLQKIAKDLEVEIRNFFAGMNDLHFKHRLLANSVQHYRDVDMKNKAECKRLAEESASTVAELEESNRKLTILKSQRNTTQSRCFAFPTFGNKQVGGDKDKDVQKDMQDMESSLKELTDLVSSRLEEIRRLHVERIEIPKKVADLRNSFMDIKNISSSKSFQLLNEYVEKSKKEMDEYRALVEKLQVVEKDSFIWREKEVKLKVELADVARRVAAFSESKIVELEQILQKIVDERVLLEIKLEEAARERSRKQIIKEFKALVSSLPKDLRIMQSEINKNKEAAIELHSLRAEVQSLSSVLHRKAREDEIKSLSGKSARQLSEIKKLQSLVRDLRVNNQELKLFLEMYSRESTDSSDVLESKDNEYKAWALVHSLKSSLDEHNLESNVKAAIEAEAISQKRLTSAEAEIDGLRLKLEKCDREISSLSDILKSKHEEGEAYLSEIESIGQAYEDMQTQNQHLLQQIIERDDYNTKLVMEGVQARQMQEALHWEVQTMDKKLHQANLLKDLYDLKVVQMDEQLKVWSDQVGKLAEDGWQSTTAFENTKKRFLEVQTESYKLRQSLDGALTKVEKSRLDFADLLIELRKERFNKKRIEESLEVMTRKAAFLREQTKGSTVLQKLRQEVKEYRGILKCSICHDRQKEVVITKCFHLFCHQCVQKTIDSRQRKCRTCGLSFGPNDVKSIYI
ncbi:E3 ubiquitin-protein ligase BRE1-like [Musa troglodytarum]|uniref:E3 ubiquitin protein ligase n=1 Tax=Musa troglodytarum TaxID=320322 RepID=A0A9E7FGQ2_9LILI|nr:E3 ubiquitin-protein ligase BRE1-like [Musa troglodytarum]